MPLVEQELLTLPEHLSSPTVLCGVRVDWSLVLCVCFVVLCLPFCSFSINHCIVCPSQIYGFWLSRWYICTFKFFLKLFSNNIYRYWPGIQGQSFSKPTHENGHILLVSHSVISDINKVLKNYTFFYTTWLLVKQS